MEKPNGNSAENANTSVNGKEADEGADLKLLNSLKKGQEIGVINYEIKTLEPRYGM